MSWKVWYRALTGYGASPGLGMKEFAGRAREVAKSLFAAERGVFLAVDAGWETVGL